MAKKFTVGFIALSLALLLLIAAAVFVIDPLYQYHLPWFGLNMPLFSERYQNPGLARQMDYDAVIIGSSMMKNNRARWYDEAFGVKALKLCFSSGYLADYDTMLGAIYARQTLDYVFLSLDVYALMYDSTYAEYPMPTYLYDQNVFNDVRYLWNRDVLLDVLPDFVKNQDDTTPFEDAFGFAGPGQMSFGRGVVLPGYLNWRALQTRDETPLPRDTYKETCADGIGCIEKHIAAHPETTYDIFLPPYSMLMWDSYIFSGQAEALLQAANEAAEILLRYDNVRFFCFLGMQEITTNLDNYGDEMHFKREVNERLVHEMKAGAFEVTRENRAAFMAALEKSIMEYDYEALFA